MYLLAWWTNGASSRGTGSHLEDIRAVVFQCASHALLHVRLVLGTPDNAHFPSFMLLHPC